MELRDALQQISQIRTQIIQASTFRGYRSLTVAFSGVLGLAAAGVQAVCLPQPLERLNAYLSLWIGVAAFSVGVIGWEMWHRDRILRSPLARQHTLLALEAIAPSLLAGALVTAAIVQRQPTAAWMLPGLWSLIFSLGIFASVRLMPRATLVGATYYVLAGIAALTWGSGDAALSPWTMAGTFGGGQLLAAAILYFTLERGGHGQTDE